MQWFLVEKKTRNLVKRFLDFINIGARKRTRTSTPFGTRT